MSPKAASKAVKEEIHPLKRKSIKPSSSTVRGMLPGPQFRALDAAMQSLRAAGMRLEWQWKDKDIGWICAGMLDAVLVCELRPTESPLVGVIDLTRAQYKVALDSAEVPEKFKKILRLPIEESKTAVHFEFPLESTQQRDLFSDFVESLLPHYEATPAK